MGNSNTLTPPTGAFTSLKEFQAYIKKYEQKQLDLVNADVWSITYLPTGRTTVTPSIYQDKVLFKFVPISLVASSKPLLGCRPLPDWLWQKRCTYATDTFADNFCV